ncbi:MAG: uL30 family ribosomal protein [Nanoarchaeota archaeon]
MKIAIIRIRGQINISGEVEATLNRLRVKRKYACVVVEENKEIMGMILRVRDCIAYGKISEEMLEKLKKARGKKGKDFFRLHPPRGGIKSKFHFPKGVLGDNGDKINDLIGRML